LIQEYIKQGEEAKARIIEAAESTAVKLEEQAKKHIAHEFEAGQRNCRERSCRKRWSKQKRSSRLKLTMKIRTDWSMNI
jgi:F-type H+-transporting ATPase subunit b